MKLFATLAICVLCTSLVLSPVMATKDADKIFQALIDVFETETGFGGRGGSVDSSSRFCACLLLLR